MRCIYIAAFAALIATSANADDFDRIKSDGKIEVATEAAFPPFESVKDGKIVGFGSDLLVEVAKDLSVSVNQVDLPFQGILAGLAAGQYDLVATSVAITPERAAKYAFTRPFAAIQSSVVVLADNEKVSKADDLAGLVVGTQLGSSTERLANKIDGELKEKGAGFQALRLYQTFADAAFALKSGQVDVVLASNVTAGNFMTSSPGTFKIALTYGNPVPLSWVVRPGNPKLLASVNATISRLEKSGELARLQEKWIGMTTPTPSENYLPEGAVQ